MSKSLPVLAEKQILEKNGVKLNYQSKIWGNEYYVLGYLNPEAYDN